MIEQIPWRDPLGLYAPLAHEPFALLLESSGAPQYNGSNSGASEKTGRWSFIAADPFLRLTARDGAVTQNGRPREGRPFEILRDLLNSYAMEPDLPGASADLPPFRGGAAGYLGYELARELERLPAPRATPPGKTDPGLPDLMLGFYDTVLAFDHAEARAFIVSTGQPERARAETRIAAWRTYIERTPDLGPLENARPSPGAPPQSSAEIDPIAYQRQIARVIEYIWAGDIFQANLSQPFSAPLRTNDTAWSLYRRLRHISPAPFAAFFQTGAAAILSSSPERFLRVHGRTVETEPIKGTRPRGATPAEDMALAAELRGSQKDRAENIMIVDLLRNDLSRVCRDHSIAVDRLCTLESFANVHHLVSRVTGELRDGMDLVDLLTACFPGGSITGAPKVRAMEIIAELEAAPRGPYCGAIGYLGFDGAMDTSIAIRTAIVKDRTVHFRAGGGITADSDPVAEYRETLDKVSAIHAAITSTAHDHLPGNRKRA